MKTICISTLFLVLSLLSSAQKGSFDYFGLASPGNKIELFAPGIISLKNEKEISLAISPFGDEVFFSKGTWPECKIMHVKKIGSLWTEPEIASFSVDCFGVEPSFSPDGKYLYFSSSKGMEDSKQYSIWRVEKVGNKWGNAKQVFQINNPDIWEFHPSVDDGGSVHFCYWNSKTQKGCIYKSDFKNRIYSQPQKVDIPFSEDASVTNPFIDPKGKFIITSSSLDNSKSGYDAYISYRDGNVWSVPLKCDKRFNTLNDDESFDISPDKKFLFIFKNDDVYWTETKGLIN